MKVSSATVALKQALAQKPAETIVIHHGDRGIQYCSNEYVSLLKEHNAMISMTESGDPLENVIAERVNGILKTELISSAYADVHAASIHISRCITIYNYRRRHSSLNWQIPALVHQQKGPQIRRWKNYYYTVKDKGGGCAENLEGQRTNNIFLAEQGTKILFAHAQATTQLLNQIQDELSSSTNTRIIINNQSTFFRTGQFATQLLFRLTLRY